MSEDKPKKSDELKDPSQVLRTMLSTPPPKKEKAKPKEKPAK